MNKYIFFEYDENRVTKLKIVDSIKFVKKIEKIKNKLLNKGNIILL